MKKYYCVGIGGSGMNPLAQILRQRGHWVGGSDRNLDRGTGSDLFDKLRKQEIMLFPQDGSGITRELDALIVSTAIENTNPELKKAAALNIPVRHRADVLTEVCNSGYSIAISGTSGKTTVTGMVASVLEAAGKDPTVINGGSIKQYESDTRIGNAKCGTSDLVVAETDESDGSITKFFPAIGVITNISKDHKELPELKNLFQTFADHTSGALIVNGDCPEAKAINARHRMTYGMELDTMVTAGGVQLSGFGAAFHALGTDFSLTVPGLHNISNALAAIAVGIALEIPLGTIRDGLATFRGIKRRLDIIGDADGVAVVDDFAHNPDKITASVAALKQMGKRLIIVFQPHGYGPTRFLLKELARAFSTSLSQADTLLVLPIYDAGGTADRNISAEDLLKEVRGPKAFSIPTRTDATAEVKTIAAAGDVIAVMGARDDTLPSFAHELLDAIRSR